MTAQTGMAQSGAIEPRAPKTRLVEMFPECDRLSGYSVAFNVGVGFFGGLTPMVATGLIATTGAATAPAVYLTAAAGAAILALTLIPDRSRAPLR